MEKLVFLFSGPFSRDFSSLVYFDGATGCRLTFQNHSKGLGRPIVVAYAHTDYVSEFATLGSAKRRAIVLFALASMLGTQLPEIEGSVQSDWTNDPFSLGAYSFIKVHSGPEDIAELASPEYGGQLLFAGEATHVNRHAHVEGAVASGVREARRLLNL